MYAKKKKKEKKWKGRGNIFYLYFGDPLATIKTQQKKKKKKKKNTWYVNFYVIPRSCENN
jgi:hypothetical protein